MSALIPITGGGAFTRQNIADINANFSTLSALGITPGNVIFCVPSSANLAQPADGSQERPYTDIQTAYSATRNGMNDVVVLVGNGAASGSARLTATLTWSNNATHLIGVSPPTAFSQRARVAPLSGTTAFANFFVLSGNGCVIENTQFYAGFGTGTTSAIAATVTGSSNYLRNCQFAGMADTASAQSAGSRDLKIGSAGSGENVFDDCVIGLDTVTRNTTNANLEFAGATPRNVFRRCIFPMMTSSAGSLFILGTGNGCVDRVNFFEDCTFANAIGSTSTTATAVASFSTGSPGGVLSFKGCMAIGATKWGDTNALANSYIDMPAVSAAAGGLGVNPS